MQKELEFNKIGMIETSGAGGFTLQWLAPISAAGDDRDSRLSGQ